MSRNLRLLAETQSTFGNAYKADIWLCRENAVLDGRTPLELLETDEGASKLEALLGRISHGIAA